MDQIAARYNARFCHEDDNGALPDETVGPEAGFSYEVMLIVIDLLYNVLGYEIVNIRAGSGIENVFFCHLVLFWGMGTTGNEEGPLCAGSGIENVISCHLVPCWGMGTETTIGDDEGPLCTGSGVDLDVQMVRHILSS